MDRGAATELPERRPSLAPASLIAIAVAILVFGYFAWLIHTVMLDTRMRSQVSEGASIAEGYKAAVADYFAKNRSYPTNNRQAGTAQPGAISDKFVSSVTISNGVITVIYGNKADEHIAGRKLAFAPHPDGSGTQWTCNLAAGTNVENAKWLPNFCRH